MSSEGLPSVDDLVPTMKSHAPFFIVVYLVFGAAGCMTSNQNPDDSLDARPIYHYWWNYYERGQRFLEARRPQDAKKSFEICLGLQPGAVYPYNKEAWQVRTYGLHILKSYFPKRELGISLFYLQDYANSLRFLEQSLEEEPSGRAKYFLNQARREILKKRTISPPWIALNQKGTSRWKKSREAMLAGMAYGDGYLKEINVNGDPVFIELAEQERAFEKNISLQEGTNTLKIFATDLLGQTTYTSLVWVADFQPPKLDVTRIVSQNQGVHVSITCRDKFGVSSVKLNDQFLVKDQWVDQKPAQREVPIAFSISSNKNAHLLIVDLAGNELKRSLSVTDFAEFEVVSSPKHASSSPPTLSLDQSNHTFHVFDQEYFLDGWARDDTGVAAIAINGERQIEFSEPPRRTYFSHRIPLSLGTNRFYVSVEDLEGDEAQASFTVVRKNPEYQQESIRLKALAKPFHGDQAFGNTALIQRQFKVALNQQPVRFYLLNRSRGSLLSEEERGLAQTPLTDPRALLRTDSVMEPELFFEGRIQDYEEGFTIVVEVKENEEASSPLLMEDVFVAQNRSDLNHLLTGLAKKLEQRFPVLEGRIEEVNRKTVRLVFDSTSEIRRGSRYVIVPPHPKNKTMKSAFVRKHKEQMVELQIEHLSGHEVEAVVLPHHAAEHVQLGDFVYSR